MLEDDYTEAAAEQAAADASIVVRRLRLLGLEYDSPPDWQARMLREIDHARHRRWRNVARDIAWAVVGGLICGVLVAAVIAWLGGLL